MVGQICVVAVAACPYVLLTGLALVGVWSFGRARDRARREARENNERTDLRRL